MMQAKLVLANPDTPAKRKLIAEWLREQADKVVKDGAEYARNYRATLGGK